MSKKRPTGLCFIFGPARCKIGICGERTFHVIYSPDGNLPNGPTGLAVITEPAPGAFTESDDADAITLKTARCGVQIDRRTGALAFVDGSGRPFLQEVADGGKSVTPSTVAGTPTHTVDQKFTLDPTEGIFGLGQHPTA